jgi:hypothetical protein
MVVPPGVCAVAGVESAKAIARAINRRRIVPVVTDVRFMTSGFFISVLILGRGAGMFW